MQQEHFSCRQQSTTNPVNSSPSSSSSSSSSSSVPSTGYLTTALQALALLTLTEGLAFMISVAAITSADRPTLTYRIEEERPPGTVLTANIARDAGITSRYSNVVLRSLSYVLLAPQGQSTSADYFHLDSKSGQLRSAHSIDRDVMCRQQWTCIVKLDVAVHPAK